MSAEQERPMQPVITLGWQKAEYGNYTATMTVSGLRSEQQAQAALDHMQKLFCGPQQEATQ